jgi:drug/metabolite transporter (DMT)-like permease
MNTRLIWGALLTAAGCIIIAMCYLAARSPRGRKWSDDTLMGGIILPLALGSCVMGMMLIADGFIKNTASTSAYDILLALGILVAGGAVIFMMRIKKRVAAYDAMRKAPEIIGLQTQGQPDMTPDTPNKPLDRAA